jgi:hypothetical protein
VHRSRLSLLAIVTASACSTRGNAGNEEILSRDPSLASGLRDHQNARQIQLAEVCGSTTVPTQPTVASKRQAQALTQQAYDAELIGNADSARSLLTRAAQLDGTDRSAAYHLGRTSEALGDRNGAVAAYCRYIALTPTMSESADARQRLADLARSDLRVAAAGASSAAPEAQRNKTLAPRQKRGWSTRGRHVANGAVELSSRAAASDNTTLSQRAAPTERSTSERGTYSADGAIEGSSTAGDGASASPSVEQPPMPPTVRRGPSRMQSAGAGAIVGAIMGGMAGRSVKSAVIGAAAGGVLGTVVGGAARPMGSSIRSRSN